tara:strand:+ start:9681 stop:10262 length:582 start_codon:yes stop_codon:yes gene_type:complete
MPSFRLIQSPQPNISTFKKTLMIVDYFQQKFAKISYLSPELLLTENRKDVEYRINFLEDVLEHKIPIEKTLYYQFIADDEKNVIMNAKIVSNDFLKLYQSVKNEGIKEPIAIGLYSKKKINVRYIINNKKTWSLLENKSKYQMINGAHRLAVSLFLGLEKVPVKIYRSFSFEIPNYTEYLKIKEPKYFERIKK